MAINDIKYMRVKITREEIPTILIGLKDSIEDYVWPIPKSASETSLDNFFRNFYEGSRELESTGFFVQRRLKKGRIGLGYNFRPSDAIIGELDVTIFDNGENIPEQQVEEIYSKLKQYIKDNKLKIIEEVQKKEY